MPFLSLRHSWSSKPAVPIPGTELWPAAVQYTRNHTLLGTAADPDDGKATFRPNAGTIIP
jgi:hypothetical protein